ncbi:hypothetical protein BJ165DRAFT_1402803 [Panaeolus papilionaceus]|nr:hypothetical protein BJ165DRAFT_1402803 [Panaeolus papilionaceus]
MRMKSPYWLERAREEKALRLRRARRLRSKSVTTKCMQRKTRCTFVKFHRQTAPVGPGHNLQNSSVASLASSLGMPPPIHASASTSSSLSASGLASNSLLDLELEGHPSHGSHRMPPLFSTHALDRRSYDDDFLLGSHSGSQHPGAPPPTAVTSMAEALGYGGAPGFGFPSSGIYGQTGPGQAASGSGGGGGGLQHTPSPEHFGSGVNSGSSVGSWDDHHSAPSGGSSRRTLHSSAASGTTGSGPEYVLGPTRDMGYGVPRSVGGGPGPGPTSSLGAAHGMGMGHHHVHPHAHSHHSGAAAAAQQQQQQHIHHGNGFYVQSVRYS